MSGAKASGARRLTLFGALCYCFCRRTREAFSHASGAGQLQPTSCLPESVVITGFNTDIEHNGTIYHVQTEDKGLRSPIILSLIYVGGEILASKRAPYDDLVANGFDPQALAERLQRQHKLICAAVSAGRIDDLKRL